MDPPTVPLGSPDRPPDYPPTVPLLKGEARGINVYLTGEARGINVYLTGGLNNSAKLIMPHFIYENP
jgi:hypothetical protein